MMLATQMALCVSILLWVLILKELQKNGGGAELPSSTI